MQALKKIGWFALAGFAACCLAVLALQRGESVNAAWVIAATTCGTAWAVNQRFMPAIACCVDGWLCAPINSEQACAIA